jgi:hypothetical protein
MGAKARALSVLVPYIATFLALGYFGLDSILQNVASLVAGTGNLRIVDRGGDTGPFLEILITQGLAALILNTPWIAFHYIPRLFLTAALFFLGSLAGHFALLPWLLQHFANPVVAPPLPGWIYQLHAATVLVSGALATLAKTRLKSFPQPPFPRKLTFFSRQ